MRISLKAYKFILFLCLFLSQDVFAKHDDMARKEQFMSVYLLHFANFIQWPEAAFKDKNTFTICVYANDNLDSYIGSLAGEKAHGRSIKILYQPAVEELESCQIVFFQHDLVVQFIKLKPAIDNLDVLSVSDAQDFNKQGGIIEYYVEEKKLRFAIDLNLAKRRGLLISSKLLRLAKIVD